MSLDHLDRPLQLGAIDLRNRAVLVLEHLSFHDTSGQFHQGLVDLVVEHARNGWAMIHLGWFAPGDVAPSGDPWRPVPMPLSALSDLELTTLVAACGNVPAMVALDAQDSASEEVAAAMRRLAGAGFAAVELPPRAARPEVEGLVVGLRFSPRRDVPELVRERAPDFDFLHAGPSFDDRLSMVGGTERQPLLADALDIARDLKRPLMVSGRIKNAVEAERALAYWKIDFVGMTRAALADPDVLMRGLRAEDWMPCTGCMACMPSPRFSRPGCAVSVPAHVGLPFGSAKLAIVGASVAALTVALRAHEAGHEVRIHSMGYPAGGCVRLRGRIPDQAESAEAAIYLRRQLRAAGLELEPDTALDPEWADVVLVSLPPVHVAPEEVPDGVETKDAIDLLHEGVLARRRYGVYGDTLLAAEAAAYLDMKAYDVILYADHVAGDTHPAWQRFYTEFLRQRGVEIRPARQVADAAAYEVLVTAGATTPNPHSTTLLTHRPDALIIADAYEPLAQREALESALELAFEALERL